MAMYIVTIGSIAEHSFSHPPEEERMDLLRRMRSLEEENMLPAPAM
ncbi:hypothetical protein IMZ48_28350 [Candidatus Bathyarchaeota archaeon]|nr:hypothetical protein [Candidatus Bathyarchaeota archaeon]